jgi:hypothetical protein
MALDGKLQVKLWVDLLEEQGVSRCVYYVGCDETS